MECKGNIKKIVGTLRTYCISLAWLIRDELSKYDDCEIINGNCLANGAEYNIKFLDGYYRVKIEPITAQCAYCGQMTFQHPEAKKEKLQVLCPTCKTKQDEARGMLD